MGTPTTSTQLHADYARFHHLHTATGDIDPVYPVLDHLAHQLDLTTEDRVRLVFTHVAYYHLGSALAAWHTTGGDFARMPAPAATGTERRAHRNPPTLRAHLDHLAHIADTEDGLHPWLARATTTAPTPYDAWNTATHHCLLRVRGNGRWAAYKTAEMLAEVAHLPLAAPDMGHAHSSGPRKGLALLYPQANTTANDPDTITALNHISHQVATALDTSIEKAETSLCDFYSMTKGTYYPGHDIDHMQHQLTQVPSELAEAAFTARAATLHPDYLGEHHTWHGVDRARKRHYRDTGQIPERP